MNYKRKVYKMKESRYNNIKPVVSLTIPANILKKLDRMADDLALSRSACATMILQIYFEGIKNGKQE